MQRKSIGSHKKNYETLDIVSLGNVKKIYWVKNTKFLLEGDIVCFRISLTTVTPLKHQQCSEWEQDPLTPTVWHVLFLDDMQTSDNFDISLTFAFSYHASHISKFSHKPQILTCFRNYFQLQKFSRVFSQDSVWGMGRVRLPQATFKLDFLIWSFITIQIC